jgi:hypothetical protein
MHRRSSMARRDRRVLVAVAMTALTLAACNPVSTDYVREHEPAEAEPIAGTELHRVIVEADAAERLGLRTAPVRDANPGEKARLIVPYGALLYDTHGGTWVYTQQEALTFVRDRVRVQRIEGDRVMLTDGPPSGTEVVTVGVAELFGVETGVGH